MLKRIAILGLASFLGAAYATPIGQLNIVGSLQVMDGELDFFPPTGPPDGEYFIVEPSTGTFAGTSGTKGDIDDLNSTDHPVDTPLSVANFLTVDLLPALNVELQLVKSGAFSAVDCFVAPAAAQTCTPPGTPFSLVNVPDGKGGFNSSVTMALSGIATDGVGVPAAWTGIISAQFIGPYQNLLATIGGGGSITTAYSGTFNFVPIPEPSTAAMLLSGCLALLGAGVIRRRRG